MIPLIPLSICDLSRSQGCACTTQMAVLSWPSSRINMEWEYNCHCWLFSTNKTFLYFYVTMDTPSDSLIPKEEGKDGSCRVLCTALEPTFSPPSRSSFSTHDYFASHHQGFQYAKLPSVFEEPTRGRWSLIWSKLYDYWALEIASCLGSLGALIGIIVFLKCYDGRKLPDWPYGITINSVLSWLVQLLAALLLQPISASISQAKWINLNTSARPLAEISIYDLASRGPFGCFWLLWQTKLRHYSCMGALITILIIGVGPFVQQMATVENRLVESNEIASAVRAQSYSRETITEQPARELLGMSYSAVYRDTYRSDLQPRCSTGECKFPIYRSLAVCSTCVDISHTITINCSTNVCDNGEIYCEYLLSNRLKLGFGSSKLHHLPTGRVATYVEIPFRSIISNVTAIHYNMSSNLTVVHQCLLYWCIRTYNTSVHRNQFKEKIVNVWYNLNEDYPVSYGPERIDLLPPPEDGLPSHNFTVSPEWIIIMAWLLEALAINDTGYCVGDRPEESHGPNRKNIIRDAHSHQFRKLMLEYGLPTFFERLADGITNGVRLLANDTVIGTSYKSETQLKVKWEWITLPALLVSATMTFLGMTVYQTRHTRSAIWKLSPMPLVCLDLDQQARSKLSASHGLVHMENTADRVYVRYQRRGVDEVGELKMV
ncbi:hypothetical protein BDV25DRAFT_40756 [Aspergillus avenaceus]|uniref:Uncharacterized protein n=1 Tax=Aspergillus avenaceus TaxID=36643 RepID=A0A5N6TL60_ASPAV|nr:hypothetical protein BDV25DRAFT_40756 [Aspergillus avenaceus]